MCLAIPGKIKEIKGRKAVVEYPDEAHEAFVGDEGFKVGDFVLVQMGVIVKKVTEEEAKVALGAWVNNNTK